MAPPSRVDVTGFPASQMRETLIMGLFTSVTGIVAKRRWPSSITMRTAFSPRFGIKLPFVAAYRTPSELPLDGTMGT